MRKLYWIAIAVLFYISACTKIDSTNIGSGLIPPIDGVTTLDTTLDVITENFHESAGDSLIVYKSDDQVIGVIKDDSIFGKTIAKSYFELKPTYYPYSFPNASTLVADSAVLILSYKGYYGDTLVKQNWEVREIESGLKNDSSYPVSTSFLTSTLLGTKEINIPSLKDSINYGLEIASNQIRIPLTQDFANRLMKMYDSSNAYAGDTAFRERFSGFAVMPSDGSTGNALIRINLLDTNTKLALFYNYQRIDSPAKRNVAVSYFRFNTGSSGLPVSGAGNYIKRDYTNSSVAQAWGTTGNSTYAYMQTSPGTITTIKVPGLKGFPNAIIHRAELITLQAPEVSTVLTPPMYLLLSSYDSLNRVKINIPNDYVVSSGVQNTSSFGGYLTAKDVPGYNVISAYTFDLSRYVQGIVSRKDSSYSLRLTAPVTDSLHYTSPYPASVASGTFLLVPTIANNAAIGRVRLGGGGLPREHPLRMRLRIIYSRI